ncbi:unnamed protein product [Ilex paraguariensis]|uniref:Uncharacterized protein n=1 Tax=Ilex paraguariensis TaxID=185542 RepID=A0ABC8UMK4_9AQUA
MEEAQKENGSSATTVEEREEEPIVGPGPAPRARTKRPLQFERAYLDALPSANMYVFSPIYTLSFIFFLILTMHGRYGLCNKVVSDLLQAKGLRSALDLLQK